VQVNVDDFGRNIPGDAGNEPSIAIDPTNPCKMAIGWRQFDSVESNFRQAGVGYSQDAGETWFFTGSLAPGIFGSDPVLASDGDGVFYYLSLGKDFGNGGEREPRLFRSLNGGATWDTPTQVIPFFADKPWMTVDTTGGSGDGHIYIMAEEIVQISRSTDRGLTFEHFTPFTSTIGTLAIAPNGDLYQSGPARIIKYNGAQNPGTEITLDFGTGFSVLVCPKTSSIEMSRAAFGIDPNPTGFLGQSWIAVDKSGGLTDGFIYVLTGGKCLGSGDPLNTIFVRSTDGGTSFSDPVRVNDDPFLPGAWQWFFTMSLAPNGRIDAVWNDTRRYLVGNLSELYYSYSIDAGVTWSKNIPVSRVFDSHVGFPEDFKLGDYYHMISDDVAANVAYAATFNGEQDVYFLRIGDCNDNGTHDSADIADGTSTDLNGNTVPDECERGDFTGDIAVDLVDMLVFTVCQTKPCPDDSCDPPLYPAPVCALGDFDADGDLDLRDFAAFQTTYDLAAVRPTW